MIKFAVENDKLYNQGKVKITSGYIDLNSIIYIDITETEFLSINKYTENLKRIPFTENFTKERALEILDIWRCL